ncbi:hypothetical protein [Pseudomonas nunensis]|uniref:RiboL-PSP-HEPN domain-containing protein n=1 Tax=Pseudomonas nunensis TaxID=2961896 RepID=A0ABY5EL77_9PSED|nr:hypothetical protein [Pseudomonas nunensis]MCL5224957.1 hypothetical protein [Pseudomonas nunensis]UTO16284.1 hypothetical protein NK667_08020 [Pseudomonas nunensis]
MVASTREFDRWAGRGRTTWPFQVFQKHNAELSTMLIAHASALKFTYKYLGSKKANWEDPINKYFPNSEELMLCGFDTVKSWSDSYNTADNWINLNCVMAISSNFETYLSTVVKLALESDTGVLFGASKRIDGIEILKHGKKHSSNFEDEILNCTKGDWNSRTNSFLRIFGKAPDILLKNTRSLESIRKIRNDLGHAFGRDIKASRNHEVVNISKPKTLSREKAVKYQKLVFKICKDIDNQLFIDHIGEYQAVHFYHKLRQTLKHDDENKSRQLGNHVFALKKGLGHYGVELAGKKFCKGLIEYYEEL